MIYFQAGSESAELRSDDLREGLREALRKLGARRKVLVVPPDMTRLHSRAGELTRYAWEYYGEAVSDVLIALGTHEPMTPAELESMYRGVPPSLFRVHDWRKGVVTLGTVPADYVAEVSEGTASFEWPVQLNRLLAEGGHDLVLSIGQVVPHEVMGMASYTKNLLVGCGGAQNINKTHYLGAIYGMERIMGKADNPVRRLLNHAWSSFASRLPVVFVHTVVARGEDGGLKTRGLFIGDDEEVFLRAAELSVSVNVTKLEAPIGKAVVFLDPDEYKSTWLGNKSIYRTRMAMADGGELVILAPGLCRFGEDAEIDGIIRKYGYRGTGATLKAVAENGDLARNLSAAAHLIHGSSEGRFAVTYCPGALTKGEIESAGFGWAGLDEMSRKYDPRSLKEGWNELSSGERIYFISNPAVGLWASADRIG
jgi:nickel-dependent lactate racemase